MRKHLLWVVVIVVILAALMGTTVMAAESTDIPTENLAPAAGENYSYYYQEQTDVPVGATARDIRIICVMNEQWLNDEHFIETEIPFVSSQGNPTKTLNVVPNVVYRTVQVSDSDGNAVVKYQAQKGETAADSYVLLGWIVKNVPNDYKPEGYTIDLTEDITIAEAIEIANGLEENANSDYSYTVTGKYVGTSGNNQYVIQDATGSIVCYSYSAFNGLNLHNEDTVTLTGPIKNYNGTPEFVDFTVEKIVPATYSIEVDTAIVNGSVTVSASTAVWGESVTVTVTPSAGYKLNTLLINGAPATVDENNQTVINVEGSVTVSATFIETDAKSELYDTFDFGTDAAAGSHVEGSSITDDTTFTGINGQILTLTGLQKVYDASRDTTGIGGLKLGTSSAAGTFTFTVPESVNTVLVWVSGYKANNAKIDINGVETTVTVHSNDGEYIAIILDSSTTKTFTLKTVSGGYRCQIDKIDFYNLYVAETYDVTVAETTNGTVSTSDALTNLLPGTKVELTITPAETYKLGTLLVNGVDCTADVAEGIYSLIVEDDTTVEATFVARPTYTVTYTPTYENGTVAVTPSATVLEGSEITITVTPAEGYTATLTVDGETKYLTGGTTYTMTVTADVTVEVEFTSVGSTLVETTGTVDFSDSTQRTSYSTSSQVWENAGIVFTNNKASSTNDVGNYTNPVRLYKNAEIVISGTNMTKIEFVCGSTTYANALRASTFPAGCTVEVNGTTVTVTLESPVESFTITSLSAQVRVSSLTVTYLIAG